MKPHPYQVDASQSIFDYFHTHVEGNPLLAMPTATGKSVVIAIFLKRIFELYARQRVMILTHSKELVKQDYEKLLAVWPGAPAGINSAGLRERNTLSPIIFAGIGSVYKRADEFGLVNLIIIDEAHLISPDEETMYQSFFTALRQRNPALRVIGFTATPWRAGYGLLTEAGLFTDFCFNITYREAFNWLINEGYLSPLVPMRTKVELNVDRVRMRGGDFIPAELQQAVNVSDVTQQAVQESIDNAGNRKHWLAFCAGVEHAIDTTEILNANGVRAVCVHSKMGAGERDEAILGWKEGHWTCAVNNNVLTTGIDFPGVDFIMMLRPTASTNLWCLDEKTEVLTTKGFKSWSDIQTSDTCIVADPNTLERKKSKILAYLHRPLASDEYFITLKRPSIDIRVTNRHSMLIKYIVGRARSSVIAFETAENLLNRWKIALPVSVTNTETQGLPLTNDELRFLGLFLSDGHLDKSNNVITISQSNRYLEVQTEIERILKSCGFGYRIQVRAADPEGISTYKTNFGSKLYQISCGQPRGVRAHLRGWKHLKEYIDKNIAESLFQLTEPQFDQLLYGIWLGDGTKWKCTTSHNHDTYTLAVGLPGKYAERLQMLACMNGYRANLSAPKPETTTTSFRLYAKKMKWADVQKPYGQHDHRSFWEKEEITTAEKVWCLQTETGTLITRRNGKIAILGNCQMLGRGTRPLYAPGFDVTVYEQRMEAIRQGGKENCLVHDYAGNTRRLGPINDPVLPRKRGEKTGDPPIRICDNCGMYNHAAVRACEACGQEFSFTPGREKLDSRAGQDALIVGDVPIVEVFKIDHIAYSSHSKLGAPDSVKVSYQCGLRQFNEYVCIEHPGWAGKRAQRWWKEHSAGQDMPTSTAEAIDKSTQLRVPSHLRVWVNKKYPEILSYIYEEKDLPTVDKHAKRIEPQQLEHEPWDEDDIPF